MARILIFSRDPGGANAVAPLAQPLRAEGHEVMLYGKDSALAKYREHGERGLDIMQEQAEISQKSVCAFVADKQPRLVLTGTSADDLTEKYMWRAAGQLGIGSIAVLDQWVNYGLRFSPYGVAEADKFDRDRRIEYMPAKICVMDELARTEAEADGIDPARLAVTGQPYFETLLKKTDASQGPTLRSRLGIAAGEKLLMFVSEPICDTYRETDGSGHYWGYTERTIFRAVLEAAEALSESMPGRLTIMVRHHPKEKRGNFADIIGCARGGCRVIVDSGALARDAIDAADLVVGMSSMLLLEAAVLGRPVLSVQIGLRRRNPFVLCRMGSLQPVTDPAGLVQALKSGLVGGGRATAFHFIRDPVARVLQEARKFL